MLDFNEKKFISSFFNDRGYVLDFSNNTFDKFTQESVGIEIQSNYGGSKGGSLAEFIRIKSDSEILKLTHDLVRYIDFNNIELQDKKNNYFLS
ncbi:hypothetical protein A5881_003878 [Enterococcus termitis]